jgi:hypothetical protein
MWVRRLSIMIGICVGFFLYDTPRASLAAAEWVRVGGTHKYDRYVDMTTIGYRGRRSRSGRSGTFVSSAPFRAVLIGHFRSSASTIVATGKADRSTVGTIRKPWHKAACCMPRQRRASGPALFPAAMTMLK